MIKDLESYCARLDWIRKVAPSKFLTPDLRSLVPDTFLSISGIWDQESV